MSLRLRFGIAAGGAVALAVVAVVVVAYAGTRSQLRDQVDQQLHSLVAPILAQTNGGGGPGGMQGSGAPNPSFAGAALGRGVVLSGAVPRRSRPPADCGPGFDLDLGRGPGEGAAPGLRAFVSPSGRVCSVSNESGSGSTLRLPASPRARALAARGSGSFLTDVTLRGEPFRLLAVGLPHLGALEVALSLANVDHAVNDQLLLLALIAAGGILLAALLGVLVARTGLGPIARFTRQAESIATHPDRVEHERLEVDGSDELARLGRTFNATLDALESSISAQRNLVADASHELRTPIATIRANLQLMRDEALLTAEDRAALRADMIDELDELTQLVGDVVELARGAKPPTAPGELRLDQIVTEATERARRRAPGLRFTSALEPTLVQGDGARIARAITNLLDNASKWSPGGGEVETTLRDGVVSVRDHGPGFHAEDLPFVFDRFHRARDARAKPGSGLGLAIVRQAAEAHGGFVTAANAAGGGALMRVGFGPVLDPERAESYDPAVQAP